MNTFGRIFRVSLFGESHGAGVGVLLDGVPPVTEQQAGQTPSGGTSGQAQAAAPVDPPVAPPPTDGLPTPATH